MERAKPTSRSWRPWASSPVDPTDARWSRSWRSGRRLGWLRCRGSSRLPRSLGCGRTPPPGPPARGGARAEALRALAAGGPLLLVLEDLHWSDPSTRTLIAWLARRRERARLLLIG